MSPKQLNLSILAGVLLFFGLVVIKKMGSVEVSPVEVARPVVEEEVIDGSSRMMDGQMPLNWQDTSRKAAWEADRAERIEASKRNVKVTTAPDMDLAEYNRLREAQLNALLEKAEQPSVDDDGESLTREEVEAIRDQGAMVW